MGERWKSMSLHSSPILITNNLSFSPYREWLSFTTTAGEYFRLALVLSSFPPAWIRWADAKVRGITRRGLIIEDPVGYRMSVLWNGIVLLQESKFLCDMMENSLRIGIYRHCLTRNIPLQHIYVRSWDLARSRFERDYRTKVDLSAPIPELMLTSMDFGLIPRLITDNWKRIKLSPKFEIGFADLFWRKRICRDKNLFSNHMNAIRTARNTVAHSKKLFEETEVQHIFDIVQQWLEAIDIGVIPRIAQYRQRRRDFLAEVLIPHDVVNRSMPRWRTSVLGL